MFTSLTRQLYSLLWSHLKLVFESQTKVMKLSSISFIATALAAIIGSATAAPIPRPFERDVNIYSRAHPDEHEWAAERHYNAAYNAWDASNKAEEANLHKTAALLEVHKELNLADMRGHTAAKYHDSSSYPLSSEHHIKDAKKSIKKASTEIKKKKTQ